MKNYWLNKRSARKQPTINSRFLNEAREIEAKWGKTGLLEGIDEKWSRSTCAVLLESQRLMNEVYTDDKESFKRTDTK